MDPQGLVGVMHAIPPRSCAKRAARATPVRGSRRSPLARSLVPTVLALSLALAGCLDGAGDETAEPSAREAIADERGQEGPRQIDVLLEGNRFVGSPGTIRVNDTITWTHRDGPLNPHTVTTTGDAPEVFDSSPLCFWPVAVPVPGICMTSADTYSHTFTVEGTYQIHCKLHGGMSMTVIVVADGAELPAVKA